MRSSILSVAVAVLSIVNLAAAAPGNEPRATGFSGDCSNQYVSGWILFADCPDNNGKSVHSSIDLNGCLSNAGGEVICYSST